MYKGLKRKRHLVYFLPFAIIFVLLILQIYLANKLATFGTYLRDLEKEISLKEENSRLLKSEIASLGGLNELAKAASEKGFVKVTSVVNFSNKTPIALNSR